LSAVTPGNLGPSAGIRQRPRWAGRLNISGEVYKGEKAMLGTILLVFLVLALVGALPRWSHSRQWGYAPSGGVGLALLIVVILVLLGRL
jgi:uncharacterized protein DUF3309